ncbi:MAG TPA: hypothetical protein EYG79_08960 [Rhodobacteraceae bacterium]|nr:hypothetical protein [Paracoccaceae bacterium]
MTPAELKILRDLAEQKRLKDMAELTRANAATALTATQMAALASEINDNLEDAPPEDLAIISRWMGWADQENNRLAMRRNIQEQQAESARSFAAISDAKTRVIKDMLQQAEYQELLHDRRKAEEEGRAPDR